VRYTPAHSPNSPPPPRSDHFHHIISAIALTISLMLCCTKQVYLSVTGCHQSSARLFCRPPYPRSTFQQVILSRQGHRQSKSFTLMAIVKQRGPLSTTMRVEPRNHTSCIAMKRETRVDNILRQSSANIVFRKTGTVETINYLSAVLSSGGSISADVVGKLVKAVGGKLNGIMFGIWTGTTHCEITMRHPDVA